jgi:hypothetical protein
VWQTNGVRVTPARAGACKGAGHRYCTPRSVTDRGAQLLAEYERTLQLLEHAVTSIRALIKACEEGAKLPTATLEELRSKQQRIEQGAARLRALIAEVKADLH